MKNYVFFKEYVITFLNKESNIIKCDCFMGKDESEARSAFRECYRHGDYKILSTAETGR